MWNLYTQQLILLNRPIFCFVSVEKGKPFYQSIAGDNSYEKDILHNNNANVCDR